MAKIAQRGGPEVRTAVVKGPRAQALPASGAPIIEGITDLARGFAVMNERINTTEAEEALIKFERAKNDLFFNPDNGYFNTQGKAAYDTSGDANEALQNLAKEYADGMSNPQSREMFMNVANRHVTGGQSDILRHSAKGIKAWEISTIKAQVENSIENAAFFRNDDKKLSVQRELGRQAIYDAAELEGVTGDALNERLQTFESSFASATIDSAIIDSSMSGQEALDKYGDKLESDLKLKFQNKIDAMKQQEKTQSEAQTAIMIANNLVARYDGNRTEILKALTEVEDPEIQSKARKEAMYQVNQLETAKVEERNDAYNNAESFVADLGSAEAFKAAHPDEWSKLTTKQQKTLESGKAIVQDWNVWHDFQLLTTEEISELSAKEIEAGGMKLDAAHRDKMYRTWKESRNPSESSKTKSQIGRTRSAQTKSAVEQIMGKKSSKWTPENLSRVDQIYALFDSELKFREQVLDRELDSEEFTNLLDGFTRKVIIEKKFWPDPERDLGDIPEEHLDELTQFLRDNDIPVTSESLVKAYEQAK